MKPLFFTVSCFFLFLVSAFPQSQLERYDSIVVLIGTDTLKNAWAGGINSAQFSEIDLNGDGIKDLFLFEKDGSYPVFAVKTFLRDSDGYRYTPQYQSAFPPLTGFALLRDFNCDGKEDIFTYSKFCNCGIEVHTNNSFATNGLQFSLSTPIIKSDYSPNYVNAYVAPTDLPAITDLDGDGDLDILTFSVWGTIVEYHQNLSMDSLGTCDSLGQALYYRLADACWGKFYENSANNSVVFPASCKGFSGPAEGENYRHSGSTLLAIDTDGDGDKDLILGDISFKNMVHLTNGGDSATAAIVAQDMNFPSNTIPADLIFPAGFFLDADHDGLKDLLVTPNTYSASDNFTSVWFYKNTGTNSAPIFNFQKNNFLQEGMIDVGSGCHPAFFDYNADGLLDLLIGNFGYFNVNTGLYEGMLALFENTGTAEFPQFKLLTRNYLNISSLYGLFPTFGDLDGDGDQDMILGLGGSGTDDGKLLFFENMAGAGNAVNFSNPVFYKNIDVGNFATPQLVDANRDGLLDLIIGKSNGTLQYYQNTGTIGNADFSSSPTINNFGGIDVSPECCTGYSSPFLYEKSPGIYSLLVGSERGTIYVYGNIDGNLNGNFTLEDSIVSGEVRVSISMADINANGKKEIAVGAYTGGMHILRQKETAGVSAMKENKLNFNVYPNPGNGKFVIEREAGSRKWNAESIAIFNLLGEMVFQAFANNESRIELDISGKPNGLYFLKISEGEKTTIMKLIKL